MRLLVAVGLAPAAVIAALGAAPAAGMTMKVQQERLADVSFAGGGCGAVDRYRMTAPAGAYGLRSVELQPDAELVSAIDESIVATVQSVAAGRVNDRRVMTWTVVGSGGACLAPLDATQCADPFDECERPAGTSPWETEPVQLGISFLTRRRVPLFSLAEMRSDARLTLSTEFDEAYDQGYGKRLTCARLSRYRGRCRFSWFIGDGVYAGSFVSTKRVQRSSRYRPDRIVIRNRGSVVLTDEYCLVTGGSNCISRTPIRYG